jgi:hypothetical protein
MDATGWATVLARPASPADRRRALDHARQEYLGWLMGFRLGAPACHALHDLLALCGRERIPAVLVLMPEGSVFQSWYPPAACAQINDFLTRLTREFPVSVINARNWEADEDFYDAHHLLPHGAAVFTRRFGGEVLRVLGEQGKTRPMSTGSYGTAAHEYP